MASLDQRITSGTNSDARLEVVEEIERVRARRGNSGIG